MMKKRIISILLVLSLCTALALGAFSSSASDVTDLHTEDLNTEICNAFHLCYPKTALSDIHIAADYGTYNGYQAVVMTVDDWLLTDDMLYLEIAGNTFTFSSGSYRKLFLAYKDGEFTPIKEAYEKGIFSGEDIGKIYSIFSANAPSFDAPIGETPKNPFVDVRQTDWFYDAVSYTYTNRLMNGISDNSFAPNDTMTRAMLVTVLWRSVDSPKGFAPASFTDIAEAAWYADAVAWAEANGIAEGVGNGKFAPDAPVSREQLVTLLYRLSDDPDIAPAIAINYMDKEKISPWAESAMRWALAKGIVEGSRHSGDTVVVHFPCNFDGEILYLDPQNTATRAQAAAILMRYQEQAVSITAKDLTKGFSSSLDDAALPELTQNSADAIADFSVTLFQKAMALDKNTVLSPLSVLFAMTMLSNGAEGNTRAEIEQAFGLGTREMDEALYAVRSSLKSNLSTVNLANSIWIKDGFAVKSQFLQDNADYLQAAVYQAPFDDSTVDEINGWISKNTDGMIPKMLDELSPMTVMALVNTLLYKANWNDAYTVTKEQSFYRADGTEETAQMLRSTERLYLEDENATGFVKIFDDSRYAFAVIVPNANIGLEDYVAGLDGACLRKLLEGRYCDEVITAMPKFKAETFVALPNCLAQMGIHDAFSEKDADLSAIAENKKLYVSNVLHRAVMDVNENGVSAAAATVLTAEVTSLEPPENPVIKTVIADRPYLYMIFDRNTKLPLFIGSTVTVE